jgi:ribonucleoside-diphosphate reductase alpha chain
MGIRFLAGYHEAHSNLNQPPQVPTAEDADTQHRPAAMKAGGLSTGKAATAEKAPASKVEAPARSASEGTKALANGSGNGHANGSNGNGHTATATKLRIDGNGPAVRSDQFARFQLDAPSCDNCGAITVRNGNCYLCHNCGNSMGCS